MELQTQTKKPQKFLVSLRIDKPQPTRGGKPVSEIYRAGGRVFTKDAPSFVVNTEELEAFKIDVTPEDYLAITKKKHGGSPCKVLDPNLVIREID